MNDQDRYIVGILEQLVADIKSGEAVVDMVDQDSPVGPVHGLADHAARYAHTGRETMRIGFHRPANVQKFNQAYEKNRMKGIPHGLDDALRRA